MINITRTFTSRRKELNFSGQGVDKLEILEEPKAFSGVAIVKFSTQWYKTKRYDLEFPGSGHLNHVNTMLNLSNKKKTITLKSRIMEKICWRRKARGIKRSPSIIIFTSVNFTRYSIAKLQFVIQCGNL